MAAVAAERVPEAVEIIARKRDGHELSAAEIGRLILGYSAGSVPDYQVAAWLMAVVWRGMTEAETYALTHAMVRSGRTLDLSSLGRRIVDKHSTGGVGDKVSLALAPIVAACGVPFAKMSGRGLGHTGGTLDKLESIRGMSVDLPEDAFLDQVRKIGVAVVGQSADIVPADKKLYALRDVTGTIESLPLIAASIMSKKLAAGADAIVLDVKVGSGAFMKDLDSARKLADTMIAIGTDAGRTVRVLLTDMSAPLGYAVGNALEIQEVVELLQDHEGAAPDLRELVLEAAGVLLSLSDIGCTEEQGRERAQAVLSSGDAYESYRLWVRSQGGDPDAPLPAAAVQNTVLASGSGVVQSIDALEVGKAAARLGAGRFTKGDVVDHSVGVWLHTHRGARVTSGSPLFTVHAADESAALRAANAVESAIAVSPGSGGPRRQSVVLERLG